MNARNAAEIKRLRRLLHERWSAPIGYEGTQNPTIDELELIEFLITNHRPKIVWSEEHHAEEDLTKDGLERYPHTLYTVQCTIGDQHFKYFYFHSDMHRPMDEAQLAHIKRNMRHKIGDAIAEWMDADES